MTTSHAVELKLATRRISESTTSCSASQRRDGQLMLVSTDARYWVPAQAVASMQQLLDDWEQLAPLLQAQYQALDAAQWQGAELLDAQQCMAPLPRAYQWADASVYRNHARLIYQWRKEPIPARYEDEPLVYQGGSDVMLSGTEPIFAVSEAHDIDLETEIAIITKDVPMGTTVQEAESKIALVVLLNDVSLRGLIPSELSKGFGFYQSKPATSFAPIAVTPEALGALWRGNMFDGTVKISINGERFGEPHANSEVVFNFAQIIAHLATTRSLAAGSIIGAGTISNEAESAGSACITEARVRQILKGEPEASLRPYLRHGDRVYMEAFDAQGTSIFGAIDQQVQIV